MTLMTKRVIWIIVALIIVIGGIATWKVIQVRAIIAHFASQKVPPVVVSAMPAPTAIWQQRLHSVGSFAAVEGVTISNELAGTIVKIGFTSGDEVKQGALLVELDIAPDVAQLHGLEAAARLAKLTYERNIELRKSNTNAQADLDAAKAQYQQAVAAVDNQRATIAKKVITAPFSGRAGIRQVNLGQFLAVGTPIVSLQSMDPIYVNFSLPQQDVTNLKPGQPVRVTVDAYPGAVFNGTINAINSQVDAATRNIQVQATLANADERLKPGMFAGVDVELPAQDNVITLPQTAIVYNPYGNAVYVVEKAKDGSLTVRQQFVDVGETRGDQVAVLKGIKPGDEVVTAGQLKLRNGSGVVINNSVVPENSPAPTPPNT